MKKTLIALATAAMATAANAAVLIDAPVSVEQSAPAKRVVATDVRTKNTVKKVDVKQEVSTFDHVGKKHASEKLEGFSSNVSVREAIEQIVPQGWDIRVNEKVDLTKKVSFAGGKTWNDTLETVGKDNFSAVFDWNKQVLTVNPTHTKFKTETITTTEDLGATREAKARKVVQPKKVVKKAVVKQSIPKASAVQKATVSTGGTWLLDSRYTLRENIDKWAKKAGWRLVWKAPDYNVAANATFKGPIDSEHGPVISIVKLYQDSNLPLKVNILGGNKVIFVESRHYVNNDVVDITVPVK